MSNWALELQQFNIERIWIRGEANILADAPSRAPWENALAQYLPIPDAPARDLIIQLYKDPEKLEGDVSARRQVLTDWATWNVTATTPAPENVTPEDVERSFTPEFGSPTPDFGREVAKSFGEGEVLMRS